MNKNFKNELDAARTAMQNLKQQHATAEANRDKINTLRPVLQMDLKAAADRLEAAQLRNLRGVGTDIEVEAVQAEYQAARDALVRQNENEELAARAMNFSAEDGAAIEDLQCAREKYFGEIQEGITKILQADEKLRSKLISILASGFSLSGQSPEWDTLDRNGHRWNYILSSCFPFPSAEEVNTGHADFVRTYDKN